MIIPRGDSPNHSHHFHKVLDLIDRLNSDYAWEVTVKRHRKKRSNPQNAYHWGVIVKMICDETGNSAEDIHEYLLGEHVGWETYDVLGNLKKRPSRRSHDMNSEDFENFNEWCRAWAASNLAMVVPLPGEAIL